MRAEKIEAKGATYFLDATRLHQWDTGVLVGAALDRVALGAQVAVVSVTAGDVDPLGADRGPALAVL